MGKPTKNAMTIMIESGEQGIHETHNVLARAWRIIIHQHGMPGMTWNKLLDGYHHRRNLKTGTKAKFRDKGNISSALAKPKLSWGSFMIGLDVMRFTSIRIVFHLGKNGKTLVIPITVLTDDITDDIDQDI